MIKMKEEMINMQCDVENEYGISWVESGDRLFFRRTINAKNGLTTFIAFKPNKFKDRGNGREEDAIAIFQNVPEVILHSDVENIVVDVEKSERRKSSIWVWGNLPYLKTAADVLNKKKIIYYDQKKIADQKVDNDPDWEFYDGRRDIEVDFERQNITFITAYDAYEISTGKTYTNEFKGKIKIPSEIVDFRTDYLKTADIIDRLYRSRNSFSKIRKTLLGYKKENGYEYSKIKEYYYNRESKHIQLRIFEKNKNIVTGEIKTNMLEDYKVSQWELRKNKVYEFLNLLPGDSPEVVDEEITFYEEKLKEMEKEMREKVKTFLKKIGIKNYNLLNF